jgi:hypothetical protein
LGVENEKKCYTNQKTAIDISNQEVNMNKYLKKVDILILVVIAIVAGGLSILDFFDISSQVSNYPLFTLFLLSMISLHLIVTHFAQEDFQDDTEKSLKKLSSQVSKLDITVYANSKEIESHLAVKILEAKTSVYDLSWKTVIGSGFSAPTRLMAHSYLDQCIIEASGRIAYREIFIFNDDRRIQKLERRLQENKSGYSCRYFDDKSNIPRIQFVIIDEDEIFFFASSSDSILCSVRDPAIIRIFKSYYEYTWNQAIPIKEGANIYENQVKKIMSTRKKSVHTQ